MLRREFNNKTIEELFQHINDVEGAAKEVVYAYNKGEKLGPTPVRVEKFHSKMAILRKVLFPTSLEFNVGDPYP